MLVNECDRTISVGVNVQCKRTIFSYDYVLLMLKRTQILKWLEKRNFSMCFLKETHIAFPLNLILNQIGMDIVFQWSKINSEGITFRINKSSGIRANNFTEILICRLISVDITVQEKEITLVNKYDPQL